MSGVVRPEAGHRIRGLLRRVPLGAVAVLLLGAALSYALPPLLRQGASAALARSLGPGATVDVTLGRLQPAEVLGGRIGPVQLHATGLRVGGVRLASLDIAAQRLDVSLGSLVLGRHLVVSRAVGLRATAVITEAALNVALRDRAPVGGVPVRLALGQGTVRATATVPLAGRDWPLAADGRFVPAGAAGITLAVDRLWVDGIPAPAAIRDRIVALLRPDIPRLDLSGLPVALAVKAVRVDPGLLTVEAVGAAQGAEPA